MKLEKVKNNKQRIIEISVVLVLFITIVVVYHGFILYKEEPNENNLNTYISVIVNGEEKSEFPNKESGLKVKEITCNNETEIYWDYESWGPVIKKLSKNNTKCRFNFSNEYSESILNGTDPVLKEGLIPVTISDDGTVKRAKLSEEWYSYANQRWANAVILEDESKKYYEGEIIPEDNIESYFVWIPRYKYKIFDVGNYNGSTGTTKPIKSIAKTIEVIFENKDTPASTGSTVGSYLTHPAFTAFGTNGLWVGKFETTGTTDYVTIKPNVTSLRNINVKKMFETAYNYQREYDSHMMKNTEWGAVAYLSHSKYGINAEVRINNNSNFITGYASADGVDQSGIPGTIGTTKDVTLPYNTNTGYQASTTGNIAGVYDMSGGAHEYMASYQKEYLGSSGFSEDPASTYGKKYFDVYNGDSSIRTYQYRILGDATGEMGPFYTYKDIDGTSRHHNNWYADVSHFVSSDLPWFFRGAYHEYGALAGQFHFGRSSGDAHKRISFRLVLAI